MPNTRNTVQRQLVLEAVQALRCHPTAQQVYHHVAARHPHVSRATVYRNLALLAHQGRIQQITPPGAAQRYDFNLAPHYHFLCRGCGQLFDVTLPHQPALLAKAAQQAAGFAFEGCDVSFTGLCPQCNQTRQDP